MRTKSRLVAWWRRQPTDPLQPAAPVGSVHEASAVSAARAGDIAAWAALIRENQELVFRSAYLGTGDTTLAEETTTLTFIYAYRSLGSLEPEVSFQAWLLRLADSCARVRSREMTQRPDATTFGQGLTPRVPATPVDIAPGTPTPTRTDREVLIDAFHVLAKEDRNVIAARYAFDFERDAAAARLVVERDALYGMLAAGLARLRARAMATMESRLRESPASDRVTAPMVLGRNGILSDDQLGSMTMAAVISELRWAPDVAAIVCERVAREAWAYPELRTATPGAAGGSGRAASDATSPTPEQPSHRSGPSGAQTVAVILGMSLVVGAFVYGGGHIGQESTVAADDGIGLATTFGDAARGTSHESTTEQDPASRPATIDVSRSDAPGASAASTSTSGSTSTPMVTSPVVSLVDARRLRGVLSGVVRVTWPAGIDADLTAKADLEWRTGDSDWASVAWSEADGPLHATLRPGTKYRFRVRALDALGHASVSDTLSVKLAVRWPRSDRIERSREGWRAPQRPSAHQRLVATQPGARIRSEFHGADVAVIGSIATAPDALRVRVDDGPWVRDRNLDRRADSPVIFSDSLDPGPHSIDIRAADGGLAVDAILILRSQDA